jgi:hypothetical protein
MLWNFESRVHCPIRQGIKESLEKQLHGVQHRINTTISHIHADQSREVRWQEWQLSTDRLIHKSISVVDAREPHMKKD